MIAVMSIIWGVFCVGDVIAFEYVRLRKSADWYWFWPGGGFIACFHYWRNQSTKREPR